MNLKKKVLVIGGGGREHAIVWKLSQSPTVEKIFCAPGNSGTAHIAENIAIIESDIERLLKFARENRIDLTIVGPEAPLMAGIVDTFRDAGLAIFGPTKAAAQLEGSKAFAKEFMKRHNIPTASFQICQSRRETENVVAGKVFPYVIKVDGLAAGKGALVIQNKADLSAALAEIYTENKFGKAAEKVVIEDFLIGEELSVFAVTDGNRYVVLHSAQDHKRIFDGDLGPNTGGMGAYSPAPLGSKSVLEKIEEKVIRPVLDGMRTEGTPYTGVLYCGLMIDNGELSVVEFNARFGDPETQVVIPLIASDFAELLYGTATGKLDKTTFSLSNRFAACVVLASKGYPGSYEKGKQIYGIDDSFADPDQTLFIAGAKFDGTSWITTGGRVFGVTAISDSLESAIDLAYRRVAGIHFDGIQFRTDIGKKAFQTKN
ncbi:MAG: phosphoribosylamine--glycine ligase [Candidatus Marinimicrobia bacterium CG08_land_8_20_14_0_20_45_22]|nr:MAG: phosphoribosylamine--glycine ligase [Candidatus Marinimicrobia bacterium CG08_land_8_20_14_0_20_45_22]